MTYFVVLNEINIGLVLALLARRRRVCLLEVRPICPLFRGLLERAQRWLYRRRLCVSLSEAVPFGSCFYFGAEAWWGAIPSEFGGYTDFFMRVEGAYARAAGFERFEQELAGYGPAVKHVFCNDLKPRIYLYYLLRDLDPQIHRVVGLDTLDRALFEGYWPAKLRFRAPARRWYALVNAINLGAIGLSGLIGILRSMLRRSQSEDVLLAVDLVTPEQKTFFDDVLRSDEPAPLFVLRNDAQRREFKEQLPALRWCRRTDGVFGLRDGFGALGRLVADLMVLYRALSGVRPTIFWSASGLAVWRARYRGLFNRYRCRNFFGRDDYTPDHHIRSQELRRIGGRSIGIQHGLPAIGIVNPVWRHIDFDLYYVFAKGPSDDHYKSVWPEHMQIISVGAWAASRQLIERLASEPPASRDIVIFTSWDVTRDQMVNAIREIAAAFPDRQVIVKPKAKFQKTDVARFFSDAIKALPNVTISYESAYEVLLRTGYSLSNATTIAAEALQFRHPSFVLDTYVCPHFGNCMPNLYSAYPEMCVRSGAEFVQRVQAIESGARPFAWDAVRRISHLEPGHVYSRLRSDLGLPADARFGDRRRVA